MIQEKVKSIIASCTTLLQLDTCQEWVEYVFRGESLAQGSALIQQQRNAINLKQGNLEDIQ